MGNTTTIGPPSTVERTTIVCSSIASWNSGASSGESLPNMHLVVWRLRVGLTWLLAKLGVSGITRRRSSSNRQRWFADCLHLTNWWPWRLTQSWWMLNNSGHCWHEAPGAIASHRRDAAGLVNECFKKIDEMKNGRPVYQSWREKNQRPVLTADPVALFQTNSVVTFFFKGSERVWKGWILPQVQWSIFDLSVKKEDLDSDVLCKRGRHISAECAHGLLFPSGGSLGGQRDNQVSPYITTRVG